MAVQRAEIFIENRRFFYFDYGILNLIDFFIYMNVIRRINDLILYFCFCFLFGTGLMMKLSFVKGLGPQTVMGLSKHDWETLHVWVGVFIFFSLLIHFIVNRLWILKVGANNNKWIALLIVALGLIVVGSLVFTPATIVKP